MDSKSLAPMVVFFAFATAAVFAGNYLYSLVNKARIAPPDLTTVGNK